MSRIYRAFPELDRFDDEQCERLLQRVRIGSRYRLIVWLAVPATAIATVIAVSIALAALPHHLWSWLRSLGGETLTDLVGAVSLLAVPSVSALLVRDLVLRSYLRRALHRHIDRVRCPGCKYVLLGQRVHRESVVCPECGARWPLAHLGIVAADLVP